MSTMSRKCDAFLLSMSEDSSPTACTQKKNVNSQTVKVPFSIGLLSPWNKYGFKEKEYAIHGDFVYYALINRARGPYEEIFVLTFKAYGPNAVRSMHLECQNKYFPYGPKSRLIRALLYTYPNQTI